MDCWIRLFPNLGSKSAPIVLVSASSSTPGVHSPRRWIVGRTETSSLLEIPRMFSKWLSQFTLPTTMYEFLWVYFLPMLGSV